MSVDKKSVIPLYHQLADYLREKIHSDEIKPEELMPSELELMQKFQLSRGTVRQAIQLLELEGLVERYPGKGTFVSMPKIEHNANKKMGFFTASMQDAGRNPSAQVLDISQVEATRDIQEKLNLPDRSLVVRVKRLRLVDGEPWAIETEYFRKDIGEKLLNQNLTGSIYEILQSGFGYSIHNSHNLIEASVADKEKALLLRIKAGHPLLAVKRLVYLSTGEPFEYASDYLRADRIKFSIDDYYQEEKAQFKIDPSKNLN